MSWRTIAFAPAPPGWRVIYADTKYPADQGPIDPVVGWLTQEDGRAARRVVAAVSGRGPAGECVPATDYAAKLFIGDRGSCRVIGPTDPDPDLLA